MLDQDVRLMLNTRAAKNTYAAFYSMLNYSGDQEKWSQEHPTHWKIVGKTQRLRTKLKHGLNHGN